MNRPVSSRGFVTLCAISLSLGGCAQTGGYLVSGPNAAGTTVGSQDAARDTGSGLDAARIRQLEDAPPPQVVGLGRWQTLPVQEDPAERRAKGRALAIGGGIVAGFGMIMLGAGALMYWGPASCDTKDRWFCDLPQRISGLGFLSAGGLQIGIGTIVLAVGTYRARPTRHAARVARAVQVAQAGE